MTYLLDTSTCVEYLRSSVDSPVAIQLRQQAESAIALCSVVKAELFYGALRSGDPDKNLARLQKFVSRFESFAFDDRSAEVCARIRGHLAARGTPIGPNDLLIAAIAKVHDLTLVTHNVSEFSRVPELRLEDWAVS